MRRDDVKNLIRAWGPRAFVQVFAQLLEGRDENGREIPKLNPMSVSIRALWEALVGPVEETLGDHRRGGAFNYVEMQEAVESTAFPSATGVLIASKVIEGYNMPGMIGDDLVTVMPSRLKQERIVGFTSLEGPQEVPEGGPYGESSFTEKYVTTDTAKKGRILEVTEETVYFDQTGQILLRASRLGEMTREEREETILAGVVDVGSSAAGYKDVYRPSGTAEALYSAGNNNYLATATPLVDWTDIDEALQYHADNVRDDRAVTGERRPIIFVPKVLLTAQKKLATGARIMSATEVRSQPAAADATNVMISGNPMTSIARGLRVLSSPLLDYLAGVSGSNYNDADDWFIGDFQKQFIWQEIWPIQTFRAPETDDARFRRDVVARYKVRYYGGIAAIDERYVIKVNAV